MRLPIKTILGLAGLGAAVYWSVKGVDFREVSGILGDMDISLTMGVLVLTTVNLVIRSVVWKFIVNPIKRVPIGHALSSYLIGVFSNLFLPFKLGDVAQGYYLGRREEISKISVVSAVLIQRVFEVTSLFLIMSLVATMFSFPNLFQMRTVILGLLVTGGVVGMFLLFRRREKVIKGTESFLGRFSPRVASMVSLLVERFLAGTVAIHNWSGVLRIMALSLLSWAIQIIMVYLTACALRIDLDIAASSMVLLIINIGLIIPLAPGNIGTFQFFSIVALSVFSVAKPKALTFAIIFQVVQGVPVVIGGGLSFFREVLGAKRSGPAGLLNVKRKAVSRRNMLL